MTKLNKTLLAAIFFLAFAVAPTKSYYSYYRLKYCYSYWFCMVYANRLWRQTAMYYSPWFRSYYARMITDVLRSRLLSYQVYYASNWSIFAPIVAFKEIEPFHGFSRMYKHIYRNARMLEEHIDTKKPAEEKLPMIFEMNECSSVETCRKTMCEGVKNDHNGEGRHYEIIKVYYQSVMRMKYLKYKNQLHDIKFFDLGCFENPEEKHPGVNEEYLSESAKLQMHLTDHNDFLVAFQSYDISSIQTPSNIEDVEEIAFSGQTLDDVLGSAADSGPASADGAGDDLIAPEIVGDGLTQMMESVF